MVQPAEQRVLAREQAEILHREIDRLPGPFRLPIVLCYFEGLTLDEAAQRLRCPAGTVRSRLARACDKLRRGLTRRGVVLSGAGLVAALSSRSASASVSSLLCDNHNPGRDPVRGWTGRLDRLATFLAQEVLKSMFVNKLRLIATTLLLFAALATGAGYLAHTLGEPGRAQAAASSRPGRTRQHSVPLQVECSSSGRVLDPQGKPVPNAMTMVYAAIKQPGTAAECSTRK